MELKTCLRCGSEKPVDQFPKRGDHSGKLKPYCKPCEYARIRAYTTGERVAMPPKPPVTHKQCTRCKQSFPVEDFPIKSHKTGQRRAICHACKVALHAEYLATHAEAKRATDARYREGNKEAIQERYRQWVKDHPERTAEITRASKEKHIDARKASTAAYRKAHPERYRAYAQLRAQRIAENGGSYTEDEWAALKDVYDNRCLWCGATDVLLVPDHITPIARGGSSNIDNIQPLCKQCNSVKSHRVMDFRPEPE